MPEELKFLSTATFGMGIGGEAWERGISWNPDVIVAQGTSSDGGPTYLCMDEPYGALMSIKKDLATIIVSATKKKIPFIFSSGSPSGSNIELERALSAVNEIAKEVNLKLKVAVIPGELDKDYLKGKIKAGTKIHRLIDTERLSETLSIEDVDKSKRIVAQMGPEPIMNALDLDVDGVITGRALDVGLYMALPLKRGFDIALSAHMAKTIECSSLVCDPQSFEPVFANLRKDHFLVQPTNTTSRCTIKSVASHAFYERSDPTREENPGGVLDTRNVHYEQVDDRIVKVTGSRWIQTPYSLKIEGARQVGYRTICICGVRDPLLIKSIDWFLEQARKDAEKKIHPRQPDVDYDLIFRIYGKNGVLGAAEPVKQTKSHELGIIIDAVAKEEAVADSVCTTVVDFVAHMDYPGRVATAANVAFAYSPREQRLGPVYEFNIWHVMDLEDPCEPFDIKVREFPNN